MYRIRKYTTGDRAKTAELLRRLWSNKAERNEEYLVWRYEDNPYLKLSLAVAEHDDEIVAVRGAHGMHWKVGDTVQLIPCLGDTAVAKSHEGRQLVQKLSRLLFEELENIGVRYVVNQTPGKVVEKISLRTGWRRVGYRNLARAVYASHQGRGFRALEENAVRNNSGISISSDPPGDIVKLLSRRRLYSPVGHHLDDAYFQWRFRNPFCEYRWVCAYDGGLIGYLALVKARPSHKKPRVRILDLWGENGEVQEELLRRTLEWGRFPTVRIWWNRFPREVVKVLVAHEFVPISSDDNQRNKSLLIRSIKPGADFHEQGFNLLDIRNWDSRMFHSDAT